MITYRDAAPADGLALDTFARDIWLETFAHSCSAADAGAYLATAYGPKGKLIADLHAGTADYRLAMQDAAIVGYAKVGPPWLSDADPGALQLSQLYVARDWHGQGVGHVLLDWTIATARAANATALFLTVWEENARAYAFYRKRGFAYVGDYAFQVGEQIDTDHILRLAL